MTQKFPIEPPLPRLESLLAPALKSSTPPNLVPLCATIPADLITPTVAYLKISHKSKSGFSFLYESAASTESIGRFSFVGADPRKVLKTGEGHGPASDPLTILEKELAQYREAVIPGVVMPPLAGGAIGYVGYDCVKYFEPKTARPMKDVLNVPESLFMMFDTIIAFDHFFQTVKVISYIHLPQSGTTGLGAAYEKTASVIQSTIDTLLAPHIPLPEQPPILKNQSYKSNIGRKGYESHVTTLKKHISVGDIIQAVPSQRFARPTTLHPFNLYRHLRTINPSPYLFYMSCENFFLVGASPELLVKQDAISKRIITHPIAGTVKRDADPAIDDALSQQLRDSLKDRAEHVMLVDLARNDINRVCDPLSTKVDRLMVVEKFSHVQHLVSQVSGVLRPEKTRFDAFRSIFPAGTVSGAPKVRAMELIAELEGEKRGVYAGAVGYFGYEGVTLRAANAVSSASATGEATGEKEEEFELTPGAMDTCIALRTMLVKDGVAYLQAGGGIVFDSEESDEWRETMNKLGANMACVAGAEVRYDTEKGEEEHVVSGKDTSANGSGKDEGKQDGRVAGTYGMGRGKGKFSWETHLSREEAEGKGGLLEEVGVALSRDGG